MGFSIRKTILDYVAPQRKLSCARNLWSNLLVGLHRRTEDCHESGAFLLGTVETDRRVRQVVYFDDLDIGTYRTGACVINRIAFSKLWDLCRATGLEVVADIHVHPSGAYQSVEDKTNPTVPRSGHIAIILPNYARAPVRISDIGIYEYVSKQCWKSLGHAKAKKYLYIGRLG